MAARVIALVNQKGGVGKSTSAQNIGAALSIAGRNVLLIDFDPSGNLTEHFGLEPEELKETVYDALINGTSIKALAVTVRERLDLVPSNTHLASAPEEFKDVADHDLLLRKTLKASLSKYDYILIDCPPSLDQLTINALNAAREVLVPIEGGMSALKALGRLEDTVNAVRAHQNKRLRIAGIFSTRMSRAQNLDNFIRGEIEQHDSVLFETAIHTNVALGEAAACGQDIFSYQPRSRGAQDYKALCQEIISQEAP